MGNEKTRKGASARSTTRLKKRSEGGLSHRLRDSRLVDDVGDDTADKKEGLNDESQFEKGERSSDEEKSKLTTSKQTPTDLER